MIEEGNKASNNEGYGGDDNERDNVLVVKFTNKVTMPKKDMLLKVGFISTLSGHADNLKAKNRNYAREMIRLSVTVNDLVHASHENIDRMVQLE